MTGAPPKVIVMNDTSTRYHHGCARVMRLLVGGLEERGLNIIARSPARHDWARDPAFMALLPDADLIVINGEGTMHHGRDAGRRLLDIAGHPVRRGKLALINALWQDNPPDWAEDLATFDLISARDRASASEMADSIGKPVGCVPDLSLSDGVPVQPGQRHGLIVGDSVSFAVRQALARAAQRLKATFLPTKTLRGSLWRLPPAKWALFCAYNGVATLRAPKFEMAQTEADYLNQLGRAQGHLTGRFHAVCLSLLTQTPFIAVTSNARKIEALLADAGLPPDRVISIADAQSITATDLKRPFTPSETKAIASFLAKAQSEASALFDALADLARDGQKEHAL